MKRIKYYFNISVNKGTEENPKWEDTLFLKSNPYSPENEEIAKKEAYNGEYTVEDDGQPEAGMLTQGQRIAQLEEALQMLLDGVTEE